jgi:hypothetical protein
MTTIESVALIESVRQPAASEVNEMKRSVNFGAPRHYLESYLARLGTLPVFTVTCADCGIKYGVSAHDKHASHDLFVKAGWMANPNGFPRCPNCSKELVK